MAGRVDRRSVSATRIDDHARGCAGVRDELSEGGLAPATVRSVYSVLRSALTAAVRLRMLPSSPCVGVKLPRATKNEQHYLDAAQVTKVAEAIDPHYRVAVYTAAWTGLRSGELWALRRKDVDLLRGSIHVRRALKEHYSTALRPRSAASPSARLRECRKIR